MKANYIYNSTINFLFDIDNICFPFIAAYIITNYGKKAVAAKSNSVFESINPNLKDIGLTKYIKYLYLQNSIFISNIIIWHLCLIMNCFNINI